MNMIFYGLIAGVLGARLGYALRFLPVYLEKPLDLVSLNPSTLSLAEGILVAILTAFAYGQRRELPLWPTLDSLAPGLAAFNVFLACAHLASGDAFGAATSVPWAIPLWGAMRHPTQVYEMMLALIVLAGIYRLSQKRTPPGLTFFAWVILTGFSYLIVGGFRGDSVLIFGNLRQDQILAWLIMFVGLLGLHLRARSHFGGGVPADLAYSRAR
jgi:phosphatidylglycerol:prolipoprotein diacylglycerol transferase